MTKDKQDSNLPTAHLANELATKSTINFTNAREWNLFLLLVAQLDPLNQNRFNTAILPMKYLLKIFDVSAEKSGNIYKYIRESSLKMGGAVCSFNSEVTINGQNLPRVRPVFAKIDPKKTPEGMVYIEYQFNELMKPFLLGFKKNFMGINPPVGIKSGYAIRFLILAKAQRDAQRMHREVTTLRTTVTHFKQLMGIEDKYSEFKDLKKRVIKPILKAMEQIDYLHIDYEQHKKGRTVTEVSFHIRDGEQSKLKPSVQEIIDYRKRDFNEIDSNTEPTEKEIQTLSFSQVKAYRFLIEKAIFPGIVYRLIIPKMPSSECFGYEDYFCEEAHKIVVEKSNAQTKKERAGVFVDWFKQDIFKTDQFAPIIEAVVARKKALDDGKRMNREFAKNMTYQEFVQSYRIEQELARTKSGEPIQIEIKEDEGLQSFNELVERYRMT